MFSWTSTLNQINKAKAPPQPDHAVPAFAWDGGPHGSRLASHAEPSTGRYVPAGTAFSENGSHFFFISFRHFRQAHIPTMILPMFTGRHSGYGTTVSQKSQMPVFAFFRPIMGLLCLLLSERSRMTTIPLSTALTLGSRIEIKIRVTVPFVNSEETQERVQ
jgi:hypothetical protein